MWHRSVICLLQYYHIFSLAAKEKKQTIIYTSVINLEVCQIFHLKCLSIFYFTLSGHFHLITQDRKKKQRLPEVPKNWVKKNLKAFICSGNGAWKASLEVPIYSSPLTKSHCVGWSTECWMGSIHCSWFYDV